MELDEEMKDILREFMWLTISHISDSHYTRCWMPGIEEEVYKIIACEQRNYLDIEPITISRLKYAAEKLGEWPDSWITTVSIAEFRKTLN